MYSFSSENIYLIKYARVSEANERLRKYVPMSRKMISTWLLMIVIITNNNNCVVLAILTGIRIVITLPKFPIKVVNNITWEIAMLGIVGKNRLTDLIRNCNNYSNNICIMPCETYNIGYLLMFRGQTNIFHALVHFKFPY